jgi:septal ring-binding cell division protein DamX
MPSDQGPTDPPRDDRNRDDRNREARNPEPWEPDDDLGPVHEQRPASDYYDDDPYDDYDDGPRLLARRLVQGGIALLAVVLFLGVVWYAYTWGSRSAATGDVPVVGAPEGAEKVEPEDPGGMDVPHQDKLVLNQDGAGESGEVERLLPPPEEPRPPESTQEPTDNAGQGQSAPGPEGGGGDGQQVAELPETTVPDQDMPKGQAAQNATSENATSETGGEPAPTTDDAGVSSAEEPMDAPESADNAPAQGETVETPTRTPERKPGGDGNASTQTAETDATQSAPEASPESAGASTSSAPTDGRYAVQMAAFTSEQAARNAWSTYQERFPEILSGQRLLLQNAEINGQMYWRVRTGPFAERSAAQSLCDRLKAREQSCLPVTR